LNDTKAIIYCPIAVTRTYYCSYRKCTKTKCSSSIYQKVYETGLFNWNEWIYLYSMNPKQVNALYIEQVRKILHTSSSSWYSTTYNTSFIIL